MMELFAKIDKGPLSGLRQFLAAESPLKMMKNAFYSMLTIKCQCCPHKETSQLICCANQLTGFYMRATQPLNGLKTLFVLMIFKDNHRDKNTLKLNSSAYKKYEYGHLVYQINSFLEVLTLEKIFQKKKVVTGKTSTLCDRSIL